jgi:cysteine desulfurase family protein
MAPEKTIYLDNAATSFPKPPAVYEAMARFLLEFGANPGRGSYRMVQEVEGQIAAARRKIAAFFNAPDPTRVIFTLNATDALNIGIKGVLREGDHVITTTMDHNSIVRPLNRMERDRFITVTRLRPDGHGVVDPRDVSAAITPRTRLVATLHASNVTGALQPIAEIGRIAREEGVRFLVDAAQTAGIYPIDIRETHVDMLGIPGHKAMLGPAGTGALLLGVEVELDPFREGGTGGDSAHPVQPEEYPHHLEAGTLNTPGIAALMEGIRYLEERGLDAIREHDLSLVRRLMDSRAESRRIRFHGPPPASPRASVISFTVEGRSPDEVAAILDASYGIAVRSGLHCSPGTHRELGTFPEGTVRVSPGPFTTPDEIDCLVGALREIAG